jgi:ATP-binding cassette, subfamily B, bacterial MsbA
MTHIKQLWRLTKTHQHWFWIGAVCSIAYGSMDGYCVYLIKPLMDQGLIQKNMQFLQKLPYFLLTFLCLRTILHVSGQYCMGRFSKTSVSRCRTILFDHLMHMPCIWWDQQHTGKLMTLFHYDTQQLAAGLTDVSLTMLQSLVMIVSLLIIVMIHAYQVAMFMAIGLVLLLCVMKYSGNYLKKLNKIIHHTVLESSACLTESFQNRLVIKMAISENNTLKRFKAMLKRGMRSELNYIIIKSISDSGIHIICMLLMSLLVILAVTHWWHVSPGAFTGTLGALMILIRPLKNMTNAHHALQKIIMSAQVIFSQLEMPTYRPYGQQTVASVQRVHFDRVNFEYTENCPILKEVTLTFSIGQWYAIKGASGCGKSTFLKLILGLHTPTSGTIMINDQPLSQLDWRQWRHHIAWVSQDTTLFYTTILKNITYGLKHWTMVDVEHALRIAYSWDWVHALPNQLHTIIGENGMRLSGGQRQRLAITRALLKNAAIIIFDEATSALDVATETHILRAIRTHCSHQRLIIAVTHRPAMLSLADHIIDF